MEHMRAPKRANDERSQEGAHVAQETASSGVVVVFGSAVQIKRTTRQEHHAQQSFRALTEGRKPLFVPDH